MAANIRLNRPPAPHYQKRRSGVDDDTTIFEALPDYPFFPCQICIADGFKGFGGCDHTGA
jgi:hypothetical protein